MMSDIDTKPGKKKFLFDLNNFDDDHEEEEEPLEEEELEPPPPTFSEEELEEAKQKAFAEGKEEGRKEAEAKREQSVAQSLERISQIVSTLYESEEAREKAYEEEAVLLNAHIFETLFPLAYKQHGFQEMKAAIADILEKTRGSSIIQIEVHPDDFDGIQTFINEIQKKSNDRFQFEVLKNETFDVHQCALRWKDGGAVRNGMEMASQIQGILDDLLAGSRTKGHDGNESNAITASENPAEATSEESDHNENENDQNNETEE